MHSPFLIMNAAGAPVVLVAYTILPWMAVMMLGYYVGAWFELPVDQLLRRLLRTGLCMLAAFVILRFVNIYGDPSPWSVQERGWIYTVLSFLNVSKYPPSLQFVLLMVGLGVLGLALFTKSAGRIARWLQVFGQVPFFYYLLHLALISLSAWIWTTLTYGKYVNLAFSDQSQWPAGYHPSLPRVYLVWMLVVVILYFPCRWFAPYRKVHKTRWLSYL